MDPNRRPRVPQMIWSLRVATCSVWCLKQNMRMDCGRDVKPFFKIMCANWYQVVAQESMHCTVAKRREEKKNWNWNNNLLKDWWNDLKCPATKSLKYWILPWFFSWSQHEYPQNWERKEIIINSPEWMQFLGLSGSVGGDPQKFCCLTCLTGKRKRQNTMSSQFRWICWAQG